MAQEIKFPRINTVMLSGHVTREIELRYTPKGNPVAKISLAFNRGYKNLEGEWVDEAHFIDVSTFGKQAENCAAKLHKGSPIIVEGYINTYSYTTKENQPRRVVEVMASKINFLEKQPYSEQERAASTKNTDDDFDNELHSNITDDDVPF